MINQGHSSIGRYAVASTRTTLLQQDGGGGDSPQPGRPPSLLRTNSAHSEVGEVADTGLLGVEMDLQIGQVLSLSVCPQLFALKLTARVPSQMTLRSKHLQALESAVANHCDVQALFGDSTMQASLLERAEHRQRFRLVGLAHELEYWPDPHTSCPPLGDQVRTIPSFLSLSENHPFLSLSVCPQLFAL